MNQENGGPRTNGPGKVIDASKYNIITENVG